MLELLEVVVEFGSLLVDDPALVHGVRLLLGRQCRVGEVVVRPVGPALEVDDEVDPVTPLESAVRQLVVEHDVGDVGAALDHATLLTDERENHADGRRLLVLQATLEALPVLLGLDVQERSGAFATELRNGDEGQLLSSL